MHEKISPIVKDNVVNVIIEIPTDSKVKYEFDHNLGLIVVDRFALTTMGYPCNYGFIPNTLGGDSDPLDILLISRFALAPGVLIKGRVIGVLNMTDEGGSDAKIVCVPIDKCDITYKFIKSCDDLEEFEKKKIVHFFERYKDLEQGKWVKIDGWGTSEDAMKLIEEGVKNCKK